MDEREALAKARAGDAQAFARLVELHASAVYRITAGIAGEADAEDVAQEVFVRLHQGLSGFKGEAALSTWIHRVAVNAALTARDRRRRRERLTETTSVSAIDQDAVARGDAPDAAAIAKEQRGAVRRALDLLPDDMRAVVVLRELEGLPFEEVARTLGIKRPTAESRMARARERLRRLLGPLLGHADEADDDGDEVKGER